LGHSATGEGEKKKERKKRKEMKERKKKERKKTCNLQLAVLQIARVIFIIKDTVVY
jgi:hypothetical protein